MGAICYHGGDGELTQRQADVLAFIDGFTRKNQRPPTRRDLAVAFGWSSVAAWSSYSRPLRKKGFISDAAFTARGITILKRQDGRRVLIRGEWYEFTPVEEMAHAGETAAGRGDSVEPQHQPVVA